MGWEKVACWSTKAAISLKRVKIEEKLLRGAYRSTVIFWLKMVDKQILILVLAAPDFISMYSQLFSKEREQISDQTYRQTTVFLPGDKIGLSAIR